MAKTKQTPRKRAGEFPCHVCGQVFTQKCNRQRHLAKHGVNEQGEKLTPKEQERLLGYNKHKNRPAKSTGAKAKATRAKSATSEVAGGTSTSAAKPQYKSVEFLSSTDSSSSDLEDSSASDSDSESDTPITLVTEEPVASTSAVVPSISAVPHTLTPAEIAEAAKNAVERVQSKQSLTSTEIAARALGLYLSETDRELEEGEVVSDDQVPAKSSSSAQPPSTVSKPDDPCVRKPTRPTKVFAPKAKTPTPSAAGVPPPTGTTPTPSAAGVPPSKGQTSTP